MLFVDYNVGTLLLPFLFYTPSVRTHAHELIFWSHKCVCVCFYYSVSLPLPLPTPMQVTCRDLCYLLNKVKRSNPGSTIHECLLIKKITFINLPLDGDLISVFVTGRGTRLFSG